MGNHFLETVIPFRFLTAEERAALRADLTEHFFSPGEVIIEQGDTTDDRVYLIEEGVVESRDPRKGRGATLNLLEAGQYFGERAALLGEPRRVEIRALEPTRCLSMTGERFLRLLRSSRPFSQAIGDLLRGKQGILLSVDRFLTEMLHSVTGGEIPLKKLLPFYLTLEPALHPKANQPQELDISALAYAVRRLPENVTSTYTYFLADSLPELYQEPDLSFDFIPTPARPRSVYEMMPGKSMILLRDGLSDLIDLVTCLCLYAVEARKLRKRLRSPQMLRRLREFVRKPGATEEQTKTFLCSLPFSEDEIERLSAIWPKQTARRLYEIALHHEDFGLKISKRPDNFNVGHSQRWATQIARATKELIGYDPGELPPDLPVHIISSNTHSVANCLSSYLNEKGEEILAWGHKACLVPEDEVWLNRQDQVYALARKYFIAHPDKAKERWKAEREAGVLRLSETAFTGIQVQLFDIRSLEQRTIDPGIQVSQTGQRALLVNIDFAFGQQAEEIISNLLMLFGKNLASINVLGKAGALQGKRGDILCPTAFLEQIDDLFYRLPEQPSVDLARLSRLIPDRGVHVGPMLTVAGTLLQNRRMLHFYRNLWHCIGLEMEGAFYFRQIQESAHLGVIAPDIVLRFLYYVSDLPLDTEANLSGRMSAIEGIPPLYAITREILSGIFAQNPLPR